MPNLDKYSQRVAQALRDRMDSRRLSCSDLADMIGYKYETVKRWRDGERPIPLDVLPKLAGALGYKNVVEFMPAMPTAGWHWRVASADRTYQVTS